LIAPLSRALCIYVHASDGVLHGASTRVKLGANMWRNFTLSSTNLWILGEAESVLPERGTGFPQFSSKIASFLFSFYSIDNIAICLV